MGMFMVPVASITEFFRRVIFSSNNSLRMRRQPALVVALLILTSFAGCFGAESGPRINEDDEKEPLRINHIQMKGTHNSYHVEPLFSPTREYMYTHQTLDVQASQQGVRQFELDVWWDVREASESTTTSTTPEQHARHSRIA